MRIAKTDFMQVAVICKNELEIVMPTQSEWEPLSPNWTDHISAEHQMFTALLNLAKEYSQIEVGGESEEKNGGSPVDVDTVHTPSKRSRRARARKDGRRSTQMRPIHINRVARSTPFFSRMRY